MSAVTITVDEAAVDAAVDALHAAGVAHTVRRPTRKAAAVVAPVFDTGDPALDAFMRRNWTPEDAKAAEKRRTAGIPKPAPLKPRRWTDRERWLLNEFNEMAVRLWRERGHVVIIDGDKIAADAGNVRVLPLGVAS